MITGSCLCGAVAFRITAPLAGPDACHCRECRRWSGHVWASTDVPRDQLEVSGEESVRWYQSSERVRRGFCGTCGSVLFWDPQGRERIAVAMGAIDAPTGTRLHLHIFAREKGDYYDIADGVEVKP
jgi:hypothetical protein